MAGLAAIYNESGEPARGEPEAHPWGGGPKDSGDGS